MSTATLERPSSDPQPSDGGGSLGHALACPHCRKTFQPVVDRTQPPRVQSAKCPHCKLRVMMSHIEAALGA